MGGEETYPSLNSMLPSHLCPEKVMAPSALERESNFLALGPTCMWGGWGGGGVGEREEKVHR